MAAGLVLGERYELVAHLEDGGFGAVWRAKDARMRREVAVKLIDVAQADVPRFEREARSLAALNHPNIVTAHDFGVDGPYAYLVLELVRGRSLMAELAAARAAGNDGLPFADVLEIADQVLDGLAAAHAAGIVHRDLKPHNIMRTDGRRLIKIVDFGIAHDTSHSTSTHAVVGTLPYMAPEQIDERDVDGRTDLYALGCVLFTLLTGVSPYFAESNSGWVAAHHFQKPRALRDFVPTVPAVFESFIASLLAKSPADRPADAIAARAVVQQLRRESGSIGMTPDEPPAADSGATPAQAVARANPLTVTTPWSDGAALDGTSLGGAALDGATLDGTAIDGIAGRTVTPKRRLVLVGAVAALAAVITAIVVAVAPGEAGSPRTAAPPSLASGDVTSSAIGSTALFPQAFTGSWTGTLSQNDGRSWTIKVTIPAGSAQGTVDYPQLKCSGTWTATAWDGTRLTVREKIAVNVTRCSQFGTFYLVADAGSIDATYVPDNERYRGSGVLEHVAG